MLGVGAERDGVRAHCVDAGQATMHGTVCYVAQLVGVQLRRQLRVLRTVLVGRELMVLRRRVGRVLARRVK